MNKSKNMPVASPPSTPGYAAIGEIIDALGVPNRTVYDRAKRESWPYTEEAVRGGKRRLYALATLPRAVVEALLTRRIRQSAAEPARTPLALVSTPATPNVAIATPNVAITPEAKPAPQRLADLAAWQAECGMARAAFVDEIERLAPQFGAWKAMREIETLARAQALPAHLQALVGVANARSGAKHGMGVRTLSRARLHAWRQTAAAARTPEERIVLLAPATRGRDYALREDVAAVLALHQRPNKPSLAACARDVAEKLGVPLNSLEKRTRRFMQKVPRATFYPGRHTGAALKALMPFRRREFLSMNPNDVWVGDGHGAKLKVAHPDTGNPFVPEVTVIIDVHRYVVGWSVSLSENCLAVSDALRHAMSRHGVPLVYYSDNGGGQKNKMLDAPLTGILGSLGVHHDTGTPGNPQGRGVIERFWQTVLIPLARRFDTFQGKGADKETLKRVSGQIESALKKARRGQVCSLPAKLPTWQQFIAALEEEIEAYNQRHRHSSLPKLDGVNHATPAEYRAMRLPDADIEYLPSAELATLFMPAVLRKAERGQVRFLNGFYTSPDLMLVDGENVKVVYDIHDNARVWVRKLTGELICEAELNGNRSDFEPKPLIEHLLEKRFKGRMKRLNDKAEEVHAEFNRGRTIDAQSSPVYAPAQEFPAPEVAADPVPDNVVRIAATPEPGGMPRFADDLSMLYWLSENRSAIDDYYWDWMIERSDKSPTFDREWRRLFGPGQGTGMDAGGDDLKTAAAQ